MILACTRVPPKRPQNHTLVAGFRPQQSTTRLAPQTAHSKDSVGWYQCLLGKSHSTGSVLAQELIRCGRGQSIQPVSLRVNPTHSCANSNQGSTTTRGHRQPTQVTLLEQPAQVVGETVPRHLLHEATLPRLGEEADLPNA